TQRSAMALVLSGGVRLDTTIMHGCRPVGGYHTITRAEGPAVIEIDGKPALEMISQLLEQDSKRLNQKGDSPIYGFVIQDAGWGGGPALDGKTLFARPAGSRCRFGGERS